MKNIKRWFYLVVLCVISVCLAQCSAPPFPSVSAPPRLMYFLTETTADSNEHQQLLAGMKTALTELDGYFDFHYQPLPTQLAEQQSLIQHIAQTPNSVILLHCNSIQPLSDTLQAAAKQGSTIVLVDSPQNNAVPSISVGNIPYKMGETLAQTALQQATKTLQGDKTLLVHHVSTGESSQRRVSGAQFQFQEALHQTALTLTLAGNQTQARQQFALFLANHTEIETILCLDEFSTVLTPPLLQENFPTAKIYGIGVNNTILSLMEQHYLTELMVPNSYSIGYTAIQSVHQKLNAPNRNNTLPDSDFYRLIQPDELFNLQHASWLFPYK